MKRIDVDVPTSREACAEHPEYPYAAKAPYADIWVSIAENVGSSASEWREPETYGTLGEYLDLNVNVSEIGPDEVATILGDIERKGEAVIAGYVGCAFQIRKIDCPEATPSPR